MKVIDLINMKYNKGGMPSHIVINKMKYKYDNNYKTYIDENGDCMTIDFTNNVLNMSVKVIEEQQDIDIQAIEDINIRPYKGFTDICNYIEEKGNEIIQAIKQLDRKIRKEK